MTDTNELLEQGLKDQARLMIGLASEMDDGQHEEMLVTVRAAHARWLAGEPTDGTGIDARLRMVFVDQPAIYGTPE